MSIGDVCEVVNGGTPKTGIAEYWGGQHQWITPAEMGKRSSPYMAETERTITDAGLQNSSAQTLPPHSVILSSRAPIGHLIINTTPMATNQGCKGLVPQSRLDHKFLYYYLGSIVDLLNDLGTGATFKELSGGKLKEVRVPLPPIPEQRCIVAILDEAFEAIAIAKANTEKNLQNAREVFDSYVELLLCQGSDSEGEIALREICQIKHGYAFDGAHFSVSEDEVAPILLTPGNFSEDGCLTFNERNTKRYSGGEGPAGFVLDVGDIVVVMTDLSSKMKILGKPAIIDRPHLLHNQRIGRVTGLNECVAARFLYYFMRTEAYIRGIKRTATGTMVKHTAPTRILDAVISLPSRQNQSAIVDKLDDGEEQVRMLERIYRSKLAALDELKKALLHQAFTGELTAKKTDELMEAVA